jgi:Spy/CpxP family protein refolding chaperone
MKLFSTENIAALSLVGALAAGTMLAGGPDGPGGPGGRHGMAFHGMHKALANLNLTQEQKDKVHAVLESQRESFRAQREQMRADHEALQALLQSDQPNATKVGTAMLKVQANRTAAKTQMTNALASVRAVLTPEQQTKLDGYIAAQKDRMQEMQGFRERRGPPPGE